MKFLRWLSNRSTSVAASAIFSEELTEVQIKRQAVIVRLKEELLKLDQWEMVYDNNYMRCFRLPSYGIRLVHWKPSYDGDAGMVACYVVDEDISQYGLESAIRDFLEATDSRASRLADEMKVAVYDRFLEINDEQT